MRIPRLGLAGGIGSGKSHVARLLAELGCIVIDSDAISHDAMAELTPVLVERLGEGVAPGGVIDRKLVAKRVFSEPDLRKWLEGHVHPRIAAKREAIMSANPEAKAFVWDSPLLYESGLDRQVDCVLFVDTPRDLRLERVKARGWDEVELDRREAAQMSLAEKKARATFVIDGTMSDEQMRPQLAAGLDQLHKLLEGRM